MESSKEEVVQKRQPFNFGIRKFKQDLRAAGAPKSYVNKAAKLYKEKVYTRVAEVKASMQKEFEEKQLKETDNASDK